MAQLQIHRERNRRINGIALYISASYYYSPCYNTLLGATLSGREECQHVNSQLKVQTIITVI